MDERLIINLSKIQLWNWSPQSYLLQNIGEAKGSSFATPKATRGGDLFWMLL